MPDELRKPTLTPEERTAYQRAYEAVVATYRDVTEVRLEKALAHAGAKLVAYLEQEGAYVVNFTVDGRSHQAAVRKTDLTLLSAGICLAGEDQKFDLNSLIGVLREGEETGQLYFQ